VVTLRLTKGKERDKGGGKRVGSREKKKVGAGKIQEETGRKRKVRGGKGSQQPKGKDVSAEGDV